MSRFLWFSVYNVFSDGYSDVYCSINVDCLHDTTCYQFQSMYRIRYTAPVSSGLSLSDFIGKKETILLLDVFFFSVVDS